MSARKKKPKESANASVATQTKHDVCETCRRLFTQEDLPGHPCPGRLAPCYFYPAEGLVLNVVTTVSILDVEEAEGKSVSLDHDTLFVHPDSASLLSKSITPQSRFVLEDLSMDPTYQSFLPSIVFNVFRTKVCPPDSLAISLSWFSKHHFAKSLANLTQARIIPVNSLYFITAAKVVARFVNKEDSHKFRDLSLRSTLATKLQGRIVGWVPLRNGGKRSSKVRRRVEIQVGKACALLSLKFEFRAGQSAKLANTDGDNASLNSLICVQCNIPSTALVLGFDSIPSNTKSDPFSSFLPLAKLSTFSSLPGFHDHKACLVDFCRLAKCPKAREAFNSLNASHAKPSTLLISGPSSSGKTCLAVACAREFLGSTDSPSFHFVPMKKALGSPTFGIDGLTELMKEVHSNGGVVVLDDCDFGSIDDNGVVSPSDKDALVFKTPTNAVRAASHLHILAEILRCLSVDQSNKNDDDFSDSDIERGCDLAAGFARLLISSATANTPSHLFIFTSRTSHDISHLLGHVGIPKFDFVLEVGLPDSLDRLDILKNHHFLGIPNTLVDSHWSTLASEATRNFSLSDLAFVARKSIQECVKTNCTKSDISLSFADIDAVCRRVVPTIRKDFHVEVSTVTWADIGGGDDIKRILQCGLLAPINHAAGLAKLGVPPPRGALLYGPPGCSKTMLAQAVATEARISFISVKGPQLISKYVGESEKSLRTLFAKARAASPALLFFDELDAVAGRRSGEDPSSGGGTSSQASSDRFVAQLLTELDGAEPTKGVVMLAATNRPWAIDPALLRPGRLDQLIYVPLPGLDQRREIFRVHLSKMTLEEETLSDNSLALLAGKSDGFSGAEIAGVCRDAGLSALMDGSECITTQHIQSALSKAKPRTDPVILQRYEDFSDGLEL